MLAVFKGVESALDEQIGAGEGQCQRKHDQRPGNQFRFGHINAGQHNGAAQDERHLDATDRALEEERMLAVFKGVESALDEQVGAGEGQCQRKHDQRPGNQFCFGHINAGQQCNGNRDRHHGYRRREEHHHND